MRLKETVKYINDMMASTLTGTRYINSYFAGIAVTMPKVNGTDISQFPCITNESGEGVYLGYDDENPLRLYHKNNGVSYQPKDNYGNTNNILIGTAQMSLIITGFRNKLKMSPEELNEAILKALPTVMPKDTASGLNLISCTITAVNTDANFMNVFGREYKVKTMKALPADIMMLELKYKIECRFNKACINTCN